MCNMVNNGQGMEASEMLATLGNCLKGSRKTIYDNIVKAAREDGSYQFEPDRVYRQIRERLLRFTETQADKQIRIKGEWAELTKHKNDSCLDFEAKWEKLRRERKKAGLIRTAAEDLIDYHGKVGDAYSKLIRLDRRFWQDPDTGRE